MCQRVSVTQRLMAAGWRRSGEEEKPSKSISKALEWAEPSAAGESEPAVGSAGSICGAAYHLPPQGPVPPAVGTGVCQTACQDGLITTVAEGVAADLRRGWGFGSPPAPRGVTPPLSFSVNPHHTHSCQTQATPEVPPAEVKVRKEKKRRKKKGKWF